MSVSFYILTADRREIVHEMRTVVLDGETFEENMLEVNMHSAGAEGVAATLGMTLDWSNGGEVADIPAFLRQCDSTLALIRDMPEMDGYDERGHGMSARNPMQRVLARLGAAEDGGGAQFIRCPRPEGYLLRNVTRLRALAERALAEGGRLVYA